MSVDRCRKTTALVRKASVEEASEALNVYLRNRKNGIKPSSSILLAALKVCSNLRDLQTGKNIHADVVETGDNRNVKIANTLVDMYGKCGSMREADQVFESMRIRDVVSWNCLIMGYAQCEKSDMALEVYERMLNEGYVPDAHTYVATLKACANLAEAEGGKIVEGKSVKIRCLEKGKSIHSEVSRNQISSNVFVSSALVGMYAKCGSMVDARVVFDRMPRRDAVVWTAMMLGYTQHGEPGMAMQLYDRMQTEGCAADARIFVAALNACADLAEQEEGKQVNGNFVKVKCLEKGISIRAEAARSGFELNIFVSNSLLDMYAKCGSMEDARLLFDKMLYHDVVSWNCIILGYAQNGKGEMAIDFYRRMREEGCTPNSRTFSAALKACGSLAALEIGRKIQIEICNVGLQSNAFVANCLIDFYGKCGSMVDAEHVFATLINRSVSSWNALIGGYSRQGDVQRVFDLFERMQKEKLQPNDITFLCLLTVCSHAGLVEKGKLYFAAMSSKYGVNPGIEHYTCMVDLFSRANHLDTAVEVAKGMPFEPHLRIWMTVLGACRKWVNVKVGKIAFEAVLRLDDKNGAAYTLMANIYASVGMWKECTRVHACRLLSKAWKKPGQSWWTNSDGIVHTFVAGDTSHSQRQEIVNKLKDVMERIKESGYIPQLESSLMNVCDDEKEFALCGHSEKLAMACALLNTPPNTDVRIAKNLRICVDCHKAFSVISKVEGRCIICRDASRFHVFNNGKCSCGDFW